MFSKTRFILAAAALTTLLLGSPLAAQNQKFEQCRNIQVEVDVKRGNANWQNSAYTLTLQVAGEGWQIYRPDDQKGRNIRVPVGTELRLNFNDGANHQVNVNPGTGRGQALDVRSGSRPAIVLVKVNSRPPQGTAAVRFDITGSPADNARINGCSGGSLFIDVE